MKACKKDMGFSEFSVYSYPISTLSYTDLRNHMIDFGTTRTAGKWGKSTKGHPSKERSQRGRRPNFGYKLPIFLIGAHVCSRLLSYLRLKLKKDSSSCPK